MILNVLVVDDEEIITNSLYSYITSLLEWELDVFKAYSAREAIKIAEHNKIDIMITDICMPDIDGLELIQNIQKIWISCRYIILTGYNKFEYAYKALQIDRVRYILKTEEYTTIYQELKKTIEDIEFEQKEIRQLNNLKDYVKKTQTALQQSFLRDILTIRDGRNIDCSIQDGNDLAFNVEKPVLLLLGRIDEDISCESYEVRNNLYKASDYIVNEALSEHAISCLYADNQEMVWLIQDIPEKLSGEYMQVTLPNYVSQILPTIQNRCLHQTGVTFSFIMADQPCSWENLAEKRFKLAQGISYSIGLNPGVLILESQLNLFKRQKPEHVKELSIADIQYMQECIRSRNYEKLSSAIRQHTDWMRSGVWNKDPTAIGVFCALVMIVSPYISYNSSRDDEQHDINPIHMLGGLSKRSWGEILDEYMGLARHICELQETTRVNDSSTTVNRIKLYIMDNYAKELSLTRLAEHVYLNASYLSRIFKEVSGMTLQDFILDIRLDHAKQHLIMTSQRIQEIAGQTGFSSSKYFCTVFKQKTGMTPNEWRTKNPLGKDMDEVKRLN
jgi:two-component system, response regulator YesN